MNPQNDPNIIIHNLEESILQLMQESQLAPCVLYLLLHKMTSDMKDIYDQSIQYVQMQTTVKPVEETDELINLG